MGGGEGSKGNLKNEEAEQVGGLEPDPRYIRCCSAVCRPGYALRDALLGLLVLLGLSVVVTVIFVVCFYVIPDEKQLIDEGILPGTAKGVIGGPEHLNEVTLREGDKYTLPPHNFDDGGKGGDFGDIHGGLSQDFSTFAPPSGGVQDTTDPALHLQDENAEGESAQDLPIVHHEDRVPEETLQPRENFDHHLQEESNDTQPEPNVGPQDGPEGVIEQGHFQRDGDRELQSSRVHPEESADSVALQDEEQEGCSPVQLPMCISSVPWTLAGSPNWLNHTSEGEMFAALPYIRSSLLDSGCSSLAPLYACSVLEPPCRNSRVLPPCRAFCEEVAQSCQPFVQGASLPGLFHCSRYPDSADPSICISAQQECSGDDDFRCSTTGLCVPSSWLCDGADDCRDNSDEQNCPLTPGNDKTDLNADDTDPLAGYGDAEYSDTNADNLDEEYQAETQGIRIPHLGYPHFDPEDASAINDPALAGPSLNDPSLLEASYRHENEEQDNLTSFPSEVPLQETAEEASVSAESTVKVQQSEESPISKVDTSRRRRPGRRNNSNANEDGLNKSDVMNSSANNDSSSDALEHSGNRDYASSGKEDDLYTDYSVRNDHFQNHPIPDVDYPARETFSVDSTSSVDQKYHQMSGDKIEVESSLGDDDENKFNEGAATDNQNDSNTPDVRTPSQRLRERLSGSNRSRQNTNSPVTRQQRPSSIIEKADNEESATVEPNQRPTRPPSRLANFQDRFREWRDKRRPTLPSDLENLSPGRNSPAPGTPGTGRPYDLVRRRPQRITTPKSEPTEGVELLRENVNRGNKQRQDTGGDFMESSNIRQPINLPKSINPDPNDLNPASPVSKVSETETIGARPTRFRPGFRYRQQSRQRTDSNSENERPVGDVSPISENDKIEDDIPEKGVLSEEASGQLPGRELYGQPTHEDTNHDQESNKSNRPSIIPDRLFTEDEHSRNPKEDQEQSQQSGEANPEDEFYRHEIHDTSYSETFGSVPPKEPINKEPFDYLTPEENFENEYHEPESLPSERHSQRDDTYAGQDRYQYSNEYGTNDDGAIYTQQSGEDEPYRPPEYRPQRTYEQHNYRENQQQQEPIRQTVQRFSEPHGTRPQVHRPSSEDNSQLNLPNDFRVSFPPPRSVRPLQQALPQRPARPHQQTAGTSSSFYNSEDALVSDLRYDIQGVNEQQYPTYQQPPIRRQEAYGSPYAGQQAF